MQDFVGLFIFVILSIIFSFICCNIARFEFKTKSGGGCVCENSTGQIVQRDLGFYLTLIGIFLICITQLILFFLFAILYAKYNLFLLVESIIFLLLFSMSLIYVYKKIILVGRVGK